MNTEMIREERRVMIIPIGLELDRTIMGLSEYKPDMVYVIYSRKDGENIEDKVSNESERFKEEFVNKIRGLWSYKDIGVDVTNLSKCTNLLKEIINEELGVNKNTSFYINISSSSKIFSFASFYLAGKYNETISLFYVKPSIYLMVDFVEIFQEIIDSIKNGENPKSNIIKQAEELIHKYKKHGWTGGPFEIIEIPYYKISKYSDYEINILTIMKMNRKNFGEGYTIENILELMNQETPSKKNKIKLNYYLTELARHGLIECTSRNRKKISRLENAGEIFLETIAGLV